MVYFLLCLEILCDLYYMKKPNSEVHLCLADDAVTNIAVIPLFVTRFMTSLHVLTVFIHFI